MVLFGELFNLVKWKIILGTKNTYAFKTFEGENRGD